MEANVKVVLLDPKSIKVGWRVRKDYGDLKELADSISEIGQLQPAVVRQNAKGEYVIIAGLRRVRACRMLGIKVRVTVMAPESEEHNLVMQLAENVKRKGFDKLEVAEGLKRYQRVYAKMHPETASGATGRGRAKSKDAAPRFTLVAARQLGVSETVVMDLMGIANLPADEKKEVEKASTTRERNVAATKALSKVRYTRKVQKLEDEGEKKAKARAKKAKAKGKPAPKAPPVSFFLGAWEGKIKDLEPESVDLVLTDPQYNLERSLIAHAERSSINEDVDWDKLDVGWVSAIADSGVLAKNSTIVAHCPLEAIGDYKWVMGKAGLKYRGALIWHKTNPGTAHRNTYLSSCEAIVWATKGKGGTFVPFSNAGVKDAHNFIEGPICGGNERLKHPAQKPLWLIRKLLKRHSQKGDVVLDLFAGTGTTLVACREMKLQCIGIEKSRKYARLLRARLEVM